MMYKNMLRMLPLFVTLLIMAPATAQISATKAKAPAKRAALSKPFLVVESGQGFDQLQQAVDSIGEGRGTIRILSGRYAQCAVQQAGEISYVAAEAGGAIFDGAVCEGKAALILRGPKARIDGLIFQNLRNTSPAPDHSHPFAAIALEGGDLSILNSLFRASDQALITADLPAITLSIRQSTVRDMADCPAPTSCAAALSIGAISKLRLIANHFSGGAIDSGAASFDARDNRFEDGPDRPSHQPLIDLRHGAVGQVRGNEFLLHQPQRSTEAGLITIAQQGKKNPSSGLVIDDNIARFSEGVSGSALLVANYSGENVAVGENSLSAGIIAYRRPNSPTL